MDDALRRPKKSIFLSCLLGNLLEHYDTALYGLLAPLLAPLFFPDSDPVVSLILAYSVMATSFVSRPLGVLFFARFVQRRGAAASLSLSLKGVAVTTFAMGFLPTYEAVGVSAPFILVLLRVSQSFFAAGETSIAPQYLIGLFPGQHKVRANGFYQSSVVAGILLASAVVTGIVSFDPDLWRMAFAVGGLTALIALKLRQIPEALDDFPRTSADHSFRQSLLTKPQVSLLLKITILASFTYLTYVIPFVFMNGFVPKITEISYPEMMGMNTALLVLDMVLVPVLGRFFERYQPRRVMLLSAFFHSALIVPAFFFLEGAGLFYVTFIRICIVLVGLTYLSPYNVYLHHSLNPHERYLLPGLGYAVGAEAIGKTAPAVCLFLWHVFGTVLAPGLYIAAIGILNVLILLAFGLKKLDPLKA